MPPSPPPSVHGPNLPLVAFQACHLANPQDTWSLAPAPSQIPTGPSASRPLLWWLRVPPTPAGQGAAPPGPGGGRSKGHVRQCSYRSGGSGRPLLSQPRVHSPPPSAASGLSWGSSPGWQTWRSPPAGPRTGSVRPSAPLPITHQQTRPWPWSLVQTLQPPQRTLFLDLHPCSGAHGVREGGPAVRPPWKVQMRTTPAPRGLQGLSATPPSLWLCCSPRPPVSAGG